MSTTPTPEGLSDEQILRLWDTRVGDPTLRYPLNDEDKLIFARAIETAALSSSARDQEGVRDEREAFETHFVSKFGTKPLTWREAEGGPYNVPDGMQDNYYVRSTQQAWEAWQARAALAGQAKSAAPAPAQTEAKYNRAREMADEVMAELEATAHAWTDEDVDRIQGTLLPRVYDCLNLLAIAATPSHQDTNPPRFFNE